MSINKPLKLIMASNILVGLYFGFMFFMLATWGIDDDAKLAKVAWGTLPFIVFKNRPFMQL